MAGLLPLYGRMERKTTRLFGRWRNVATVAVALLTLFGVLLLYTSSSSLSQSTAPPAFHIQQQQRRYQDTGARELAASSSSSSSAAAAAALSGEGRLSDNAEVEVNELKAAGGYGARRKGPPAVLRDEANEKLYSSKAIEEVEQETSVDRRAVVEAQGARGEGLHSEPEVGVLAGAPSDETVVAAVDTLSGGQRAGPDQEGGAASQASGPPSTSGELHYSKPVAVGEGEGAGVVSRQAVNQGNLHKEPGANKEREGEGEERSEDSQQSLRGADVEKQKYVKNVS